MAVVQALADEGRLLAASRTLRRYLRRRPRWAPGWNRLAVYYGRLGHPQLALAALQRALAADPAYAPAWNNLGNLCLQRADLAGAERAYRTALALQPSLAAAHRNLAAVLWRRGRPVAALVHTVRAWRLGHPDCGQPRRELARWLSYLGLALLAWLIGLLRGHAALAGAARGAALSDLPRGLRALPAGAPVGAELPVVVRVEGLEQEVVPARLGLGPDGHSLDLHAVQHLAEELERGLARPPQQPRVYVQPDGSVRIVPGRPGRRIDAAALARAIEQAMMRPPPERTVEAPWVEQPPRVTDEQLQALSQPRLLGRYRTRLGAADSPQRVVNIRLAAGAVDGVVLAPGQSWSFNQQVGPRLPEQGYLEAPVLRRGVLAVGYGGGVCQVSTTLFNAGLLAGLRVKARSPHSTPVPYVPPGRDATVVYGYLDLVLENPLPVPVALSARLEGNRLTVAVYGPPQATVPPLELRSLVEAFEPAGRVEVPDPQLGPGQQQPHRPGRPGYSVSLWREWNLYGPWQAREGVAWSDYPAYPEEVRVGPPAAACPEDVGSEQECRPSR